MLLTYVVSCILLLLAYRSFGVSRRAGLMTQQLRESCAIIVDAGLDEEEKERAVRESSLLALKMTFLASLSACLTLAIGALPIALGIWSEWYSLKEFVRFSIRWDVLLGTVITLAVIPWVVRRLDEKSRDGA